MRITQGCFSFLPDLTDQQASAQVEYCLNNGWPIGVEYTDDPHPRNMYWQLFGHLMFDLKDAKGVMMAPDECRKEHPETYIRFNATAGFQIVWMSFIARRQASGRGT
jgi:ribulose-bisphosphate carboxylase small chain